MRRLNISFLVLTTISSAFIARPGLAAQMTNPAAAGTQNSTPSVSPEAPKGGIIHGHIKSGATPIPGVSVTATNTLTGKKYATTTDINGLYSMAIPSNGRYVVKSDLAAFASVTHEALLNAASHDQTVDFEIQLASRAQQEETQTQARATRQYSGTGAQSLSLSNGPAGTLDATDATNAPLSNESGAQLPTMASNSDLSNESVAISGQVGVTSPFAGINADQFRNEMENRQQQDSLSQIPGQSGSSSQGGNSGGVGMGGPGGGPGGGFGMMGGGGRGGRGNFRSFRPDQPHGSFYWNGGNSALDAQPFALRGQETQQSPYNSNHFGLSLMGEPYIPKLTKPSGKDTFFLNLSGQRSSNPVSSQYATVPTTEERSGDLSNLTSATIYNPATGKPFTGNQVPVSDQAKNLLRFIPEPNLPGTTRNYYRAQTQQSNTFTIGSRYMRSLGTANTGGRRTPSFRGQFGATQQGLRQSINVNFNYNHAASDNVNIFPSLGGKTFSNGYSVQAGYVLGMHRLTNNITLGWSRSHAETTNSYTGRQDIATQLGILAQNGTVINSNPLNYGLPKINLKTFTGLSDTQPSLRIQQTISVGDTSSWRHGKHNFRFGGDFRRIHLDMLSSSNSTGTFYFTGFSTQAPSGSTTGTGSDFADFLLGKPQESTIQAPQQKAYTRANSWDLFLQVDFRLRSNFTMMYGLRYEYFSPYAEKDNHLVGLDPNATFDQVAQVFPGSTGAYTQTKYPKTLIYPFRRGLSPRIGAAWRPFKETVVRGGYGINFTNGQYGTIIRSLVYQPPYANVQTNLASSGANISLAQGFPGTTTTTIGNYAVDPHYRLPYVQVWNLNVQRTLPYGLLLNVGYNGAKGSNLDITTAPGGSAGATRNVIYNYESFGGYSRFHAGTVSLRKRMQKGISLGATYTYSHGIDNAGSVGGTSTVVAQNWQRLDLEEGNSSFDQRHKLTGNYVFELPFGPDKPLITSGWWAHALSNILVSGNFTFASGTPLTPSYTAAVSDVARGTAGSLRPNRDYSKSITSGAGSLNHWFNVSAFSNPGNAYGTASRNSITGPGTISHDMSLSKTVQFGDARGLELRATASNVFNVVQYSGVDSNIDSSTAGYITSAASMRRITFMARYRF